MVRGAEQADVPSIAQVHVQAWRETYTGLVPQEVLDTLSLEERAAMWRGALGEKNATSLLVCEHGKFVSMGKRSSALQPLD